MPPKKPTPRKPAAKKPATKKPAAKKPATKKSAAKKPATPKPAARKTAAKKATRPAAKKPAARKPAARKPAPRPATPPPRRTDDLPVARYSLAELGRLIGPATEDEVRTYVGEISAQELSEIGSKVATPRISSECARVYGQAWDFLQRATPEHRRSLIGVSDEYVRIAVWAAFRGHAEHAAREGAVAAAVSDERMHKERGRTLREQATARIEQLYAALDLVIAGHPLYATRLDESYTRSHEPLSQAESLQRLADLGAAVRESKDPGLSARLARSGLSAELLVEIRTLARHVEQAGRGSRGARALPEVTQAEVDRWDGINLTLLRRLIYAFDAAHTLDPTVPRLPLYSLRAYFYGRPRERAATPPTPPAPTP
ncbi:MAG: hypothetical protein U1A78_02280 [Polyangia bacterium]